MAKTTSVYPIQQNHTVDVGETPVEVLVEDKRHTVERTTQPNPVEIIIPSTTIYTAGIQGPPGPPTGLFEEVENLAFIGSGEGVTKTKTAINGNVIYEEFGIGDELFVKTILLEKKAASLVLHQEIYKDEKILFSMKVKVAYLKNAKPSKIPNEMFEVFKND